MDNSIQSYFHFLKNLIFKTKKINIKLLAQRACSVSVDNDDSDAKNDDTNHGEEVFKSKTEEK